MNDVGRYRLTRRIGSGGMAEVLEGVAMGDHGFERRVAIKRMHASGTSDASTSDEAMYARMFLDEARIAAQLHHANIVAVLDYGVADGRPFQVLEHVDGMDVRGLTELTKRALPEDFALYICSMVGHALEYAHAEVDARGNELGIVHRDVTPGNILVAWSGDVKLTDFGIAFAHDRAEQTMAGMTKGTPQFMSPEQQLADAVDGRSDVFSLGCVLHWMVAGWSPLARASDTYLMREQNELDIDETLPEDVRTIVTRATRHRREDRYASASEFAAALTMALAARGVFDPRTALRAWLRELQQQVYAAAGAVDTVRDPEVPAPRGRLDALLDLELVFARADSNARVFETVVGAATKHERPVAQAPETPPPLRISEVLAVAEQPRPRHRVAVLVVAALGALAIAVVLVAMRGPGGTRRAKPVTSRAPIAVPTAPVVVVVTPDAASGVDAAVVVDAAAIVVAVAPPDAAIPKPIVKAKPTPVTLAEPAPPTEPTVDLAHWQDRHHKLVRELSRWTSAHAAGAMALREWSERTQGDRAFLQWLHDHSPATLDDAISAHPGALGTILAAHRDDFEAFIAISNQRRAPFDSMRSFGIPWSLL